jgi:hypothetical protein
MVRNHNARRIVIVVQSLDVAWDKRSSIAMSWGSLKDEKDREALGTAMEKDVGGLGEASDRDYFAAFVYRTPKADFFIGKLGVRTIYQRGWDEEWYDVYNWNALLYVRKKTKRAEMERLDEIQFETYDQVNGFIEKCKHDYPTKFLKNSKQEEKHVELPDYAKSIFSQALAEFNGKNEAKILDKVSRSVAGTEISYMREFQKLIEAKKRYLRAGGSKK